MNSPDVTRLETEWDYDSGFFGLLRQGVFDRAGFQRLVVTLKELQLPDGEVINRRMVSLLWFIPQFMDWQRERFQKKGYDMNEYDMAATQIASAVAEKLGYP